MRLAAAAWLILFVTTTTTTVAGKRVIQATNINDYAILQQESISIRSATPLFAVTSEFPVSSLLYNDNYYLSGGTPLDESDLILVVTSDCSEDELGGKPIIVTLTEGEDGGVAGIDISKSNTITADVDDLSFLETSRFQASWTYEGFWCNQYNEEGTNPFDDDYEITDINKNNRQQKNQDNTEHGILDDSMKQGVHQEISSTATRQRGLFISAAAVIFTMFFAGTSRQHNSHFIYIMATVSMVLFMVYATEDSNVTFSTNTTDYNTTIDFTPICRINVELLHDGCRWNPLGVQAPVARLGRVVLQDQEATTEECTTFYEATLTFPETIQFDQDISEKPSGLPQLPPEHCYRAVEGRPFLDQSGLQIQAQATTNQANGWCSATATKYTPTNNSNNNKAQADNYNYQSKRSALGQEWTRRALGEHSSVSSFAAFTIALMSNNAPPDLIQDSLTAASDEIRHAKASFEIASLLTGQQTVEPGPLPPSAHRFDHNLTQLALTTAQEGCIDETLSAVLAVLEVDQVWSQTQEVEGVTDTERDHIRQVMMTIAMEESQHSALAWRTIAWVCEKDSQACQSVQEIAFDKEHLKQAVQKRTQSLPISFQDQAEKLWESIYSTLVPTVTGASKAESMPEGIMDDFVRGIVQAVYPSQTASQ